jgi:2-polyprenyl-3-methyl-5-hydroxy-6-metoxy-1,4-benzoquinol methylase
VSEEYEHYLTGQLQPISGEERVKRNARFAWLSHRKHFPSDTSAVILEVGPGFGAMLDLLCNQQNYTNVYGVDISPEVVDACNQVCPGSTELADDTTEFLSRHPQAYDLILMLHVLEHIPQPEILPLLQAVRQALKPGGKLVVEVPNMANPLTAPYHRHHDFTHQVGFTDQSLAFVLRTAGFSSVQIYPCKVHPTSPARALQRLLQEITEMVTAVMLRIYMPRQPVILASVLGACASV